MKRENALLLLASCSMINIGMLLYYTTIFSVAEVSIIAIVSYWAILIGGTQDFLREDLRKGGIIK